MEAGLLWGSFLAGMLTVLTPCVLPLLPVYLSVLLGAPLASAAGEMSARQRLRLFSGALAFSAGFIAVFTLLGLTATAVGGYLVKNRVYFSLFGGLVILLFGLRYVGWLRVSFLEREARFGADRWRTRFALLDAFLMGVVFAFGWTPCVGPILGAVLTFTASRTTDPAQGAAFLALYGAGFAVPLLALSLVAAGAAGLVRRLSRWLPAIERATGVLLVVVGLYLMTGAVGVPSSGTAAGVASSPAAGSVTIDPPLGQPSKKPRFVEFYEKDCGVCLSMVPLVDVLERACGAKGVEVIRVEVSGKENLELARLFKVRGVPTFVYLDRDGSEAARLIGYQTAQSLKQAMGMLLGDDRCGGVELLEPPLPGEPSTCRQAP
jgi:cytochrome c-type biogenesis protein